MNTQQQQKARYDEKSQQAFLILPRACLDLARSDHRALAVLTFLSAEAYNSQNVVEFSLVHISDNTGLHRDQVKRALAQLVKRGYIKHAGNGQYNRSRYACAAYEQRIKSKKPATLPATPKTPRKPQNYADIIGGGATLPAADPPHAIKGVKLKEKEFSSCDEDLLRKVLKLGGVIPKNLAARYIAQAPESAAAAFDYVTARAQSLRPIDNPAAYWLTIVQAGNIPELPKNAKNKKPRLADYVEKIDLLQSAAALRSYAAKILEEKTAASKQAAIMAEKKAARIEKLKAKNQKQQAPAIGIDQGLKFLHRMGKTTKQARAIMQTD